MYHTGDQNLKGRMNPGFDVIINKEYQEREHFVLINSSNRDIVNYPFSNSYKILFDGTTYKNVSKIELVQAIIPNKNAVLDQGLLLLNIKNLPEETLFFNEIKDVFCSLPMKNATTGGFIILEPGCGFAKIEKKFTVPIGKLDKIEVQLLTVDGTIFDFGQTGGNLTRDFQTSFLFKLTTVEVKNTIQSHF
jgi:hypothetical protein